MPRPSRRVAALLLAGAAAAALAAAPVAGAAPAAAPSGPSGPSGAASWLPPTPANWPLVVDEQDSRPVTITRGVTSYGQTWDTVAGQQRVQLLDVDLADRNVRVDTVESHDRVQDPADETVTSMGDRTGAVAGINGDYFDINASGAPLGGVVRDGVLVKSPRPDYDAQLAVHADGSMSIGEQSYSGTVTDGPASHPIGSVNVIGDAAAGSIVRITPDLGAVPALPAATLALLHQSGSGLVVDSVSTGVTAIPALTPGQQGLVADGAGGAWLAGSLHAGDRLSVHDGLAPDADLTALLSGATVLVKDGAAYTDPLGTPPGGTNPETAVGLSRDGRHATFVAIDGREGESTAVGVTVAQATGYLLEHGAYSAILLDGGGSTTLAAREPGDTQLSILNRPSDASGERPVSNGLFVYSTEAVPGPARRVVINAGAPITTVPGAHIPVGVYALDARDNPAAGSTGVQVRPSSLASYQDGALTVHRAGVGLLVARNGAAISAQPLRVVARLAGLSISPTAPDLVNGATQQFTLAGTASGFLTRNGAPAQVPAGAAQWSVSPAALGRVDASGLFTAAATGGGLATVTATVGGRSASATVAVGSVQQTIDPMDDATQWNLRNTTGNPVTFRTDPADLPPGSSAAGSLELSYSLAAKSGVKQLVLSAKSSSLTTAPDADGRYPTGVGLWIDGDGSGIDTAIEFIGADGTTDTQYPSFVTWRGWQFLSIPIPADLQAPVRIGFFDLLGINPATPEAGTIHLSDLAALYSPRPVVVPPYVALPDNPAWLRYEEDPADFAAGGATVLVGDDAHLLASDPGSAASNVLDAVAGALPALPAVARPQLVQTLGDMSDDGALPDLQFARDKIAALGLPYRDAVGNHEITQGADPETGNFAQVFGDTHYAYGLGAATVIVTDSAHGGITESDGDQSPALPGGQWPWLVQQLTDARTPAVVVVTHMPAYDPHPAANSEFADRWEAQEYVRLVQRYIQTHPGRRVVMMYGHARGFAEQILAPDGQPTSIAAGGVPQLTFADLGQEAYAPPAQGGFYHYGLIHVTASGALEFAVQPVLAALVAAAPTPTLAPGARESLTATGTNVSGDNLPPVSVPIADPVSHVWSSSDPRVASVDAVSGVLVAHRRGTATVSVRSGGRQAGVTVTVS